MYLDAEDLCSLYHILTIDACDAFWSYLKATEEQSVAASVKALEERQERILSRLHHLQSKVKKMIDEDVSKSVPHTSHVSSCTVISRIS